MSNERFAGPGPIRCPIEVDLLAGAAAGNAHAWDRLVDSLLPDLWAAALGFGLDAVDAADVCQLVCLRLAQRLHEVGHPDLGHPDLGHPDLGHPDLGHPDLGHPDLGHPDLGQLDAGGRPAAGQPELTPAEWLAGWLARILDEECRRAAVAASRRQARVIDLRAAADSAPAVECAVCG